MFQMSPFQSWMTFIVLMLLVAAVVWLAVQAHRRAAWDRSERDAHARRSQFAVVTEMQPRPERHLTLVTDINARRPKPALYDWRKQGI